VPDQVIDDLVWRMGGASWGACALSSAQGRRLTSGADRYDVPIAVGGPDSIVHRPWSIVLPLLTYIAVQCIVLLGK